MPKQKKHTLYSLNDSGRDSHGNRYRKSSAQSLRAWIRMSSSPEDLGPYSLSPAYLNSPTVGESSIGSKVYGVATSAVSGNKSVHVTSTDGYLSFSKAGDDGAPYQNSDLPFSVGFWFKPSSLTASYLFGKRNSTGSPEYYMVLESDGMLKFVVYDSHTGGNPSHECETTSTPMASRVGVWNHIVCTYNPDPVSMKIYLNGEELSTATTLDSDYVGMYADHDQYLGICSDYQKIRQPEGDCAEFAVWGAELASFEVEAIYNAFRETIGSQWMSGFVNDSPRLQIRDLDHRLGAYPTIARSGDPDFLGKSASYYDDSKTVNFLSSYARAWIQFDEVPLNGSTIVLTDAEGVSKTFYFIRTPTSETNAALAANPTYTPVIFGVSTPGGQFKSLSAVSEEELKGMHPGSMTHMKNVGNWNPGGSPHDDPGANLVLASEGGHQADPNYVNDIPKPRPTWSILHLHLVAQIFADAVMKEYSAGSIKITSYALGGDYIGRVLLKQTKAGTDGNTSNTGNNIHSDKAPAIVDGGIWDGLVQWTSSSFEGGKNYDILHSVGMLSGSDYSNNLVATPNALPTLFADGEVSQDVPIGNNCQFHVSNETISPFNESRVYLGAPDSVFYKNSQDRLPKGSGLRIVDPIRFGSPLRDKTIITIDINPSGSTKVWWSTGSNADGGPSAGAEYGTSAAGLASGINSGLVYYNFNRKMWESIGDLTSGSNVDIINTHASVRTGSMLAFGGGPFTKHYGEAYLNELRSEWVSAARASGMPTNYAGFPVASKFNATGSQLLDMSNYITHPFLLEKVVIEWSGTIGAMPANFENTPCVASNQFFILNQYQNEIQTTFSTLNSVLDRYKTPNEVTQSMSTFNCTRYKELVWFGRVGVYDTTAVRDYPGGGTPFQSVPKKGFLAEITSSKAESIDLWVPTDDPDTAPSGTFVIEKPVTIASQNEISVGPFPARLFHSEHGYNAKDLYFMGTGGSRDLFGTPSGRSYQRSVPGTGPKHPGVAPFTPLSSNPNIQGFKVRPYTRYEDSSPYLLMPTDKLIIGFANQQIPDDVYSHVVNAANAGEYDLGYTGSHVSTLCAGRGRVTFYGSHIRDGEEYHSTVNQPLTSPALHEALHFDNPIVDQFMVEPSLTYSGTYIDNVVDGHVPDPTNVNANYSETGTFDRAVIASVMGGSAGTTGSMSRFRAFVDRGERYLDSMPGNPAEYHVANGFNLLAGYGAYTDLGFLALSSPNSGSVNSNVVDSLWGRSFPFESKYSHIARAKSINDLDKKLSAANLDGDTKPDAPLSAMIALSNNIGIISQNSEWLPRKPGVAHKMMKYYFGIGDRKTISSTFFAPFNHRGEMANLSGGILNADVTVRGFKYGIINSVGQNSRAVYRHDRYGQFRDMLEQRQFSRYYSAEDGLMESGVEVLFLVRDTHAVAVDPETTNSQNMSVFATSSLPFFDDPAFTLSTSGISFFNVGRMRGSMPPDLEVALDVTTDLALGEEAMQDAPGMEDMGL